MEIPPISIDDVKDCPGGYIECEICRYGKECLEMRLNKIDDIIKNNEEDSNMNTENKNTEAIDPFMIEDEQSKDKKSKVWQEIFLICPKFSDFIIDFYEVYGQEGLNDLIIMYNPKKKKFEFGSKTPAPSSEDKKEEK